MCKIYSTVFKNLSYFRTFAPTLVKMAAFSNRLRHLLLSGAAAVKREQRTEIPFSNTPMKFMVITILDAPVKEFVLPGCCVQNGFLGVEREQKEVLFLLSSHVGEKTLSAVLIEYKST